MTDAAGLVAAWSRYGMRTDIHEALLSLGCALIRWQSLRKAWMTGRLRDPFLLLRAGRHH